MSQSGNVRVRNLLSKVNDEVGGGDTTVKDSEDRRQKQRGEHGVRVC